MGLFRRKRRMFHQLLLSPDAYAPAIARRRLERALRGLPQTVLDDVMLLTTEVVTNSVRHSGTGTTDLICLEVRLEASCVQVRVTDAGRGRRFKAGDPSPTDDGGRGLMLVSEISDRWGVERTQVTTVWFEVDFPGARINVGA
jgi:anti-sigma regulatory factor (Ser/Thr protein kinase)